LSDTAVGITFALVASVSWAVGSVLVRLGLEHVGARTATFFSVIAGLVYVLTIALILDAPAFLDLTLPIVLGFALVGLLSFGAGRFLYYTSVNLIGVGRATAIGGATPIVSAALAVIVLGEVLTLPLGIGIVLVAGGIVLIVGQDH
jgi:drug/metabolite transporter (DMT)-like permease